MVSYYVFCRMICTYILILYIYNIHVQYAITYRGADKSLARPGRKRAHCFCQKSVNFLRRLILQENKNLDGTSRLDVVEIARVPDMLPSSFPP